MRISSATLDPCNYSVHAVSLRATQKGFPFKYYVFSTLEKRFQC